MNIEDALINLVVVFEQEDFLLQETQRKNEQTKVTVGSSFVFCTTDMEQIKHCTVSSPEKRRNYNNQSMAKNIGSSPASLRDHPILTLSG